MKPILLGSLSLLLMSAVTAPAFGSDKTAINPAVINSTSSKIPRIEPFDLINLAYRGYFKDQGIPGYSRFILACKAQQVSAQDIVQSAVIDKKLPSQVLNNKDYVDAVRNQLDEFIRSSNRI